MNKLNIVINWIVDNKEWIFSGIGVSIIALILAKIISPKSNIVQKSKEKSVNIVGNENIVKTNEKE